MSDSTDRKRLLFGLNDQQREAVTTTEGPVLVLAGAGTGKTKVVTHRISYLLRGGVPPDSMLAVSFTNRAAGEMSGRVTTLAKQQARGMKISTFHSLGLSILRTQRQRVGLQPNFQVMQFAKRIRLAERLMRSNGCTIACDGQQLLDQISLRKNIGTTLDDELSHFMRLYDAELRKANMIDLDDMIILPARILSEHPETRAAYQKRYRYLMVDEYQDTNEVQHQLLMLLVGDHQNLCVVGDDDQSIYGFRGSVVEKILNFEDEFPQATMIRLETNYRSTKPIIDFANAAIETAKDRHQKRLRADNIEGPPVRWLALDRASTEQRVLVDHLDALRRESVPLSDIAVLHRVTDDVKTTTNLLRRAEIPVADSKNDGVSVMTLHASKGLEFAHVVLAGVEESVLPHHNAIQSGDNAIEEERRLFYVGATRAQTELVLTTCHKRLQTCQPSRFLQPLYQRGLCTREKVPA